MQRLFDSNALTLGFARRFATYKRPNLLLHDPERLLRLLNDQQRPVQLIIAGKAHPADQAGQAMIQEWMRFVRRPEARPHVVFLSDYDMHLTEELVQGVDVWLNTPRRPWEACGTSGMKVLVNGGLNLSELDGWWAEAYTPEIGWALGDGQEHDDAPAWDAIDAEALYNLLEQQVVPEFYTRDEQGIPKAWVTRIRESMAQTDATVFDQSHRRRIHRAILPAEGRGLPSARCRRRQVGQDDRQLAALARPALGRDTFRRTEVCKPTVIGTYLKRTCISANSIRMQCASSSTPKLLRPVRRCGRRCSGVALCPASWAVMSTAARYRRTVHQPTTRRA